ncbi:RNA-binding protein 34 [Rhineura floridana]|uniref:RNA-binding protein 34 n=1 Tax=Rhineura floridana TaxID=261503 RepID=UPI002AC7E824|nr:RNA-binding protein 34 [Rhineura floridana]
MEHFPLPPAAKRTGSLCLSVKSPFMLGWGGGSGFCSGRGNWGSIFKPEMKPSKVVKVRPGTSKACGKEDVAVSNEDYIVGQVANSLFQNQPTACGASPLVRLFSAPEAAIQPLYVAVPRENKKRKHTEEAIATEVQNLSTKGEPLKKTKKAKKDLSLAEEKVASRECVLDEADEEEKKEEQEIKQKLKNRHSKLVTKKLSTSDEDAGLKRKKTQVNLAEEMLKNKRTLFVGNLPVSCTAQMLKMFFKEYGQIESVRFRSLIPAEDTLSKKMAAIKRKVHPNMKYINAYVVFKEECAANKALKRNGTEFTSGFHIRVDLASKSTCHDNKRSVFVGNLPYEIDDDTVRDHFSECGSIISVRIVRDRNTGIGKGFGYVLFETTDSVHLSLKLNNSELKGRRLRVKRCVEREKAQQKCLVKNVTNPVGLKYTKASSLKNAKGCSSNSYAGEKAASMKKNKKGKSKNQMKKKLRKSK